MEIIINLQKEIDSLKRIHQYKDLECNDIQKIVCDLRHEISKKDIQIEKYNQIFSEQRKSLKTFEMSLNEKIDELNVLQIKINRVLSENIELSNSLENYKVLNIQLEEKFKKVELLYNRKNEIDVSVKIEIDKLYGKVGLFIQKEKEETLELIKKEKSLLNIKEKYLENFYRKRGIVPKNDDNLIKKERVIQMLAKEVESKNKRIDSYFQGKKNLLNKIELLEKEIVSFKFKVKHTKDIEMRWTIMKNQKQKLCNLRKTKSVL